MRVTVCVLIMVCLSLQACAQDGGTPNVDQRSGEAGDKQTLIATVFGEPLYLEQVTPANVEIKSKELPRGEFDEWLRKYRGRRTYTNVWRAVERKEKRCHPLFMSQPYFNPLAVF